MDGDPRRVAARQTVQRAYWLRASSLVLPVSCAHDPVPFGRRRLEPLRRPIQMPTLIIYPADVATATPTKCLSRSFLRLTHPLCVAIVRCRLTYRSPKALNVLDPRSHVPLIIQPIPPGVPVAPKCPKNALKSFDVCGVVPGLKRPSDPGLK